ncbi:hypothetical protein J2T55_001781 [Methylohalomonas lacus]|uniref:DUF4197 domain-containing protein n=1 Tax=Methylohalomonas lacus TaxID=398773 RepID=A0AAE3HK01_9GAMM|nr:DUF4197 domain-containing protein [Methylohalomonas lacus]MCS3903750.1 hypothetical protein [Methylohalomonas lacus]
MTRTLTWLLLFMLTPMIAQADGNWWDKGKQMLEGFGSDDAATTGALSNADIAAGLREALRVGSDNVVSQLGQTNGYYEDPKAHIPLPDNLKQVRDALARVGLAEQIDDLELRMNRAAEAAAPKARTMFVDAIRNMTLDDARAIYNGPEDAATRYFQEQMSTPLEREFTPMINNSLAEVGAIQTYDQVMNDYQQLPFVPDIKANLSQHVVDHAIGAIFDYLAVEEAAIRANPAKRTTELLQKVFAR